MILWHVHDPMCAWCWAFRPTWEKTLPLLPSGLRIRRLLGGLAPDSEEPMPPAMRAYVRGVWERIHSALGIPFNFDFWAAQTPRRSTYPACRAALAARRLAPDREEAMILAIQEAYYLRAENPSDAPVLAAAAERAGVVAGASGKREFAALLAAPDVDADLQAEIAKARALGANGFPALVLEEEGGLCASVALDYENPDALAGRIAAQAGALRAAAIQASVPHATAAPKASVASR